MPETLAQKIKAKYPGVYDDIPDAELESKVLAKYPGVYDDLPRTAGQVQPRPPAPPAGPETPRTWGDTASDLAIGAGKGLANTVTGLGEMAYRYVPGVQQVSDAVQRAAFGDVIPGDQLINSAQQTLLAPSNTAQQVGFTGEQIGEFFIPAAKAGALAKVPGLARVAPRVAQAGQAALLTGAQGGSGTEAGVSGALAAAFPAAGAARRTGQRLQQGAEKNIAQALGATTRDLKKDAMAIAPEMIRRGVRGSRERMRELAADQVQAVGARIGQAVDNAAQAGQTLSGSVIRGNIQLAKDALSERMANGRLKIVPGYEQVAQQLDALDDYVRQLPADIPFDLAHRLKQRWDSVVDAAGLFGTKGIASAADKSRASAFEKGADAFRDLLNNGSTTLADLNREFGFWKKLSKVSEATALRTQAQTGGLMAAMGAASGAAGGLGLGDSVGEKLGSAAALGLAGRNIVKLIQSPAWRTTVTAPMKQKLADALASGSAERVSLAVGRIVASLPAQLRAQFGE